MKDQKLEHRAPPAQRASESVPVDHMAWRKVFFRIKTRCAVLGGVCGRASTS